MSLRRVTLLWLGKCCVNLTWWLPRLRKVLSFKMLCTCSREQVMVDEGDVAENVMAFKEVSANGFSAKTTEVETKLDEGNIEEAESSLREALSLNYEEARALLGRLEYQRGNIEAALQVFEGIELHAVVHRLRSAVSEKNQSKRGRLRNESVNSVSLHAASLLLEAIYLKAMSLQKLGRLTDAAQECKSVLDTVETVFPQGMADFSWDHKLHETVGKAVELLPQLWKQAGLQQEAMTAYRRALLSHWNLDADCCARIQKEFAVLLLYGGVEAGAPSLAAQIDGSFVPRNNTEEAILILMILLRKCCLNKIPWDPAVMDHLCFALSLCGQTFVLAKQIEEVMPGTYARSTRWNDLALCYSGARQNKVALNLLRKSLNKLERPNDLSALLLAARICSEDFHLASEGIEYARRALENAKGEYEHLKGVAYRLLGLALEKQAKVSSTDLERTHLRHEALKSLEEANTWERQSSDLIFELALEHAQNRNLNLALSYVKEFLDITAGSLLKGWRLLALILSAQKRYSEAEVIIDAALDETGKWEQGVLLRTKAKLQIAQSSPMNAIETYRLLLALVQAQRKSFGTGKFSRKVEGERVLEVEVWQDLACIYSSLFHWRDAEICLDKAKSLKISSSATFHALGVHFEARSQMQEALSAYSNALSVDPDHVPSKVSIGALMVRTGGKSLPVARSFLSDALRLEPTNHTAWYYLGMVHKADGRAADAADCFKAASMLEESAPIEHFSSAW
ncbi:protein NPG1 isoform X2 [Cryptomeria japonica]|uniref:protein NPG1 isoform X2 n=1 Tax=Cryptomeria japonica TaxID=3369 RepID=UPI0025ACA92C|nr:protein NPG1 isoform X2 [Cryptomeria japonica]